jgi:thiamine biosynthesis lipoprotein
LSGTAPVTDGAGRLGAHRTTRWSTRIEVVVTDPAVVVTAAHLVDGILDRVELAASRFREDSGVRLLQRAGGRPVPVLPDLYELVEVALRAAAMTDGAVDPTVGAALCRLGYDRDFAVVARGVEGELPHAAPVPGWRTVELDASARTVTVPPGTLLDLGATAKAWAADRAAAVISTQLGCGALVSLGGDLAVGSAPAGGFTVGVADICGDPDAPTAVAIRSGGLATSGIGNRHWLLGGTPVHHLLDPSTGLPVATHWRTVTVAAGSCVDANTASTASLVRGEDAPAWLAARSLPARLVAPDGAVVTVAGWPDDPASAAPAASAASADRGNR